MRKVFKQLRHLKKGDHMSNNLTILLLILAAVVLSGCTGTDSPVGIQEDGIKFDRANPNLDAKIVDVKFDRNDIRAGEEVMPELFIANTGSEKITNETVEITAKLITLDDTLANLYLKTMSDEKKTRAIDPIHFKTEIEPGTVKAIKAKFHTVKEMEGRSLAGTYQITMTLSVNGQKIESKILRITLYPGDVREFTPIPTPVQTPVPTSRPALASTNAPKINETQTPAPTPTPTPTPEPVVVGEPTGKIIVTRVMSDKFTQSHLDIDVGDEVQWMNFNPNDDYDIKEMNEKIAPLVLRNRISYIFNKTGEYKFGAYYRNMKIEPSIQTISVRVNASK